MIASHALPAEIFTALASGDCGPAVISQLREVQRSKHLMLLGGIAANVERDGRRGRRAPEAAAFRAGYRLLAAVQQERPEAFWRLVDLPHIGRWAHACFDRAERGLRPDLAYLAAAAAAAAVQAGIPFELTVPVCDGRVLLPGLGYFDGAGTGRWTSLRSDGDHLTVGTLTTAPCAALVPDDGSGAGRQVPHWQGTPAVHAVAGGFHWETLLETTDRALDRFMLPMSALSTAEAGEWRRCLQSAWQLLVCHHEQAAGQIGAGISVVVPLTASSGARLESATTAAAFGAVATSPPPDPVSLAETLVHEFEHIKLDALLATTALVESSGDQVYAPWRADPRPLSGLLQGIYAHLGVARFWQAQRRVTTEPDSALRAQVTFDRVRRMTGSAIATLLRSGRLTPDGCRFVTMLREQERQLAAEAVPAPARAIAAGLALDHWVTWQLRHGAVDACEVTGLALAFERGQSRAGRPLPAVRVEQDTRKVAATAHGRMLARRYGEPLQDWDAGEAGRPAPDGADAVAASGSADEAVQACAAEILRAPDPRPDAWAGLALAAHRSAGSPLGPLLAAHLPVVFEMHACLLSRGVRADPLELTAWLA